LKLGDHDKFCRTSLCGLTIVDSSLTYPKGKAVCFPDNKNYLESYKKNNQWFRDHLDYILYEANIKDIRSAEKVTIIDDSINFKGDVRL